MCGTIIDAPIYFLRYLMRLLHTERWAYVSSSRLEPSSSMRMNSDVPTSESAVPVMPFGVSYSARSTVLSHNFDALYLLVDLTDTAEALPRTTRLNWHFILSHA